MPDLPETLQVPGFERLNQRLIYKGVGFLVKPDISPVVRNHFLVIPKDHHYSFRTVPAEDRQELEEIKNKIENFYRTTEGKNALFFEHGCCEEAQGSACIHHAHLHSVPVTPQEEKKIITRCIGELGIRVEKKEPGDCRSYLRIESSRSVPLFWEDTVNVSQLFRIMISDTVGEVKRAKWQNCILDPTERKKSEEWLRELAGVLL